MRFGLSWLLGVVLAGCFATQRRAPPPPSVAPSSARPRLVVQITVDQLRADLLARYADRYVDSGLARFLREGLLFTSAHYAHAATETAVGHATLFSGALPQDHGIASNEWYDLEQRRPHLAVEDSAQRLLGQPARSDAGASPRALWATTLGDQLVLASRGVALVFAASIKDRGAIFAAGHSGKAFWFDDVSGDFVTSDYYYPAIPGWLADFNARRPADGYKAQAWQLLLPAPTYRAPDERPYERSYKQLGRVFPHPLAADKPQDFYKTLKRTPFSDELTLGLVEALLAAEPLGRDETTDLLSISFSATDYIAHAFGPESREVEDDLLRLDRNIARLFELLLGRLPASDLLVVLSADHGGAESPEFLQSLGLPAGRHDVPALLARLNDGLEQRLGKGARYLLDFVDPTLWLDEAAISQAGLALELVERTLSELVLSQPGFLLAVPRSDLARGNLPPGPLQQRVQNSFVRGRTGHVYLVAQPGWLLASDGASLSSMHGSPHRYDTHVPIAFWGHGLHAGRSARSVDPRDIAVTLAALLGVTPPSAASGQPLVEVLQMLGR